MLVWIDIDNPPQVQYLLPLVREFEGRGDEVVVTARDNGITLDLLRAAGADHVVVGTRFGRTKLAKGAGVLRRVPALISVFRDSGRPDLVLSSSRSSALAARMMGIPVFIICDYEWVDLRLYRLTGATLLFPDVIDPTVFEGQGFKRHQLIAFHGLKEDLSFGKVLLEKFDPHVFTEIPSEETIRVLFRPPAEESHYYSEASGTVTRALLARLAKHPDVVVIFSPRYEWQSRQLSEFDWAHSPIVLKRPIPFIPLLKASDIVISSGGTMLREAAYLGIPAVSAFGGRIGGVDRFLETIGRIRLLKTAADLDEIELRKCERLSPLAINPDLSAELAASVTKHASSKLLR